MKSLLSALTIFLAPLVAVAEESPATKINFARDIQPILADQCFACHGPDEKTRKAGLRLDERTGTTSAVESGAIPIVPGKPTESELIRRINSNDASERMPPDDSKKSLTSAQKELLTAWIAQGAEFDELWSFAKPHRAEAPAVSNEAWSRTPIDRMIMSRLDAEGMTPTAEASRESLIRRLSLDLTGLPPTLGEIDAFLADESEDAYERVVDRLFASPHFGERMAVEWLDAARFADTNGYHLDNGRDMSRWRSWVIDAFNENMPFDQFTIEQLAGDLLPNATLAQQVASGFNRNHMINFEGGAVPAEYHNAYIVDRVNTTATVWLGLTVACAQCHDHKYDPITQKEFYGLYAFFNNVPENGLDGNKGNAMPYIRVPNAEQSARLRDLDTKIEELAAATEGAIDPMSKEKADRLTALRKERTDFEQTISTSMVMQEMSQPRDTFVLTRGQYDKQADKVTAHVPASLPPLPKDSATDRLALARWLVSPEHPLTARVIVNRYWQMFFGTGLVETSEDLGSRGELPSHPELLDWLAVEFQESSQPGIAETEASRWNVKALLKLIVMSATYRQDSRVTAEHLERDPANRLLARGPRVRLQAEFIRDQALAVSGLLQHRIGGPSVSPYQPAGLWEELSSRGDSSNWTAQVFAQSNGEDLYRRSMYTFWKRTSPPPQMLALDAPDRETCTVRRTRTNTPLQALILMNDPTYVEASRSLAERVLVEGGTTDEQRLTFVFRHATARSPSEAELGVMQSILREQTELYKDKVDQAKQLLSNGDRSWNSELDACELAAWTMLSSMILNLDETVTKS